MRKRGEKTKTTVAATQMRLWRLRAASANRGEKKAGASQRAVQMKLAVGAAGDRYEREADRVAEQVLTAPVKGAVESSRPRIQRFAGHSAAHTDAAPKSVDSVLSSQGRPLSLMA